MEERLELARERAREAEADLVQLARPVMQAIAERCAKTGFFVGSGCSPRDMEIKQVGARAKEVSVFCNGALSEPMGGCYFHTSVRVCGDGGRYNTIHLYTRSEPENPPAIIPAAADLWSGILADARAKADAALVEMREAARDLVDILFVSAMPENIATFEVRFNLSEPNSNPYVEAFLKRADRTAYYPSCYAYRNVLFPQILDAFQRDMQETAWHVEWKLVRDVYTITATKIPQETQ